MTTVKRPILRPKSRIRIAAVIACLACAVGGAAAATSRVTVAEPGDTPTYNTGINGLVEDLDFLRSQEGFGSFVLDSDANSLAVLRKGEPQEDQWQRAIELSNVRGVDLAFKKSDFTLTELERAKDIAKALIAEEGWRFQAIGANPENSGLEAVLAPGTGLDPGDLASKLETATDMPVIVSEAEQETTPRSRNNMAAPFKGGGVLTFSNGNT